MSPQQQLSPALEEKLAYFATVAGIYESAAALAGKVGISIEDSTVRQLVQRLGARAETQMHKRLQTEPVPRHPQRGASPLVNSDDYNCPARIIVIDHAGPDHD